MARSLVEEVRARARAERDRTTHPPDFPALPPVPAARYADPDFAALERDAVFGRSWLMVAHVDEVPEPGSYRLVEHLPKPVFVLHGVDGVLRAFVNTCMHRGAALVTDPSGSVGRRLTCPYHSWVYDHEGALVGYPQAHDFPDLDRDCAGLTPVRCETWGPLVFVNLDVGAPPLDQYLHPVDVDLSELSSLAGRLHLVDRTEIEVDANWKLPVDANIETYHVNTVHRATAGKILDQAATGIQLLRNGHSRMLIALQGERSLAGAMPFPALFEGIGDLPASGTFSFHVFPNLSIVFSSTGFLFFITNWPVAPGRSAYRVHWCSSLGPDVDGAADVNSTFTEINRSVLLEDLSVLPGMQRSLDAGALPALRLGYQERRIYHLHETIDRAIGVERIPPALRVEPVLAHHVEA